MIKYSVLFFVSIVFLGCSHTVPHKSEYRINPKINIEPFVDSTCQDKSLKIAQAFSSNVLRSQDMNYALGDETQYVYSASLWSLSPNRAITAEFLSVIRDSNLFKHVQTSKSRSRSDIILEINIEDFIQYFNEDSSLSHVDVSISVSLIDTKSNAVFASKIFKNTQNVQSLNSSGGVKALNKALQKILMQSNSWLGEVCK